MKLTPIEMQMYDLLAKNPEGVGREILAKAEAPLPKRASNYVDVHIKNLRKKLKKEGMVIVSMRGVGYKLLKDTK